MQPGPGERKAYTGQVDNGFLREIDKATHANPLFAVGGIPGTVGSGTRSLWQDLVRLLRAGGNFAIWPFQAETYPRLVF